MQTNSVAGMLGALCLTTAVGLADVPDARANPESPVLQSVAKVGEMTVVVFGLSRQEQSTDILKVPPARKGVVERLYPDGKMYNTLNVMLVEGPGYKALVDTAFESNAPALFAGLADRGIGPQDITHVILTHAHPDHIGGLSLDGKAAYPRARLILSREEHDFWTNRENFRDQPGTARSADALAKVLALYGDRVDAVSLDPSRDFLPGLRLLPAFGHTPGHTMALLSASGKNVLFWGDLVHAFRLQAEDPSIRARYDMNASAAADACAAVLRHAARERWLVTGAHMPDPGLRTVERLDF